MAVPGGHKEAMDERPGELSAELHVSLSISWGFFLSNDKDLLSGYFS